MKNPVTPLKINTNRMTPDEIQHWERNGYFVRENVFSHEENDHLRQVAEDIVAGKRKMPMAHIDRNALVRDGKHKQLGIYAMHKIHHPSCYIPEFLDRVRDPRLTDPLLDILGPDILGINNLFLWKAPEIGLGFPWHQDKFYFGKRFKTATTVGTWTAIDPADRDNGCLYVIPGSHKQAISEHDDIEGSQQNEFECVSKARRMKGIRNRELESCAKHDRTPILANIPLAKPCLLSKGALP